MREVRRQGKSRKQGFKNLQAYKQKLYDGLDLKSHEFDFGIWNFHLDHIIPYCIGGDTIEENLQLITRKIHNKKTGKDKMIINELRKLGWIESLSDYEMELIETKDNIIEYYSKRYNEMMKEEIDIEKQ